MTQTHALFLEWFAIGQAMQAGRYSLENGNAGARPHTPAPLEADCHEIRETAATLLATLGQPIFEPLTNAAIGKEDKGLFYCKGAGADAVGEYTTESFVVLNGSRARSDGIELNDTAATKMRGVLMAQGVLRMHEGFLTFTNDYLFKSPSAASGTVLARASKGWIEWKTAQGQTLDEVKRQVVVD
jgi:Domain of unknown function (DUF4357)